MRGSIAQVVVGVFVGALLAGGGAAALLLRGGSCLDRCGDGTACLGGKCVVVPPPPAPVATPAPEKKKRRRGSTSSVAAAPGDPLAAPELTLQPGDEVMQAQGDALGRPEVIDFNEGGAEEKLTDEQIERVFASVRPAISSCIGRAAGDYPIERAHVEVGLRIERTGRVEKVRVTAPALLQRQGVAKCIRPLCTGLHYPASGGASVVTFPFDLQ